MLSGQNPSIVPPPSGHNWHANVGASRTLYARVSASAVTPLASDGLVQAPRPPPAQAESPRGEYMTKRSIASIALAAVVCVLSTGIALADATVTFPSSNTLYSTAGNGSGLMGANGDQSAPLYTAGDSVSETFFTAQPTVNSLALTLQLVNYFGNNTGSNYENDIYVNGVNVANFLVPD